MLKYQIPLLRKLSCTVFTCFLLMTASNAQVKVYQFEDGTLVPVEVLDEGPDGGHNSSVYFGALGYGGIKFLGFDYYKPQKYFLSGMVGLKNHSVDFNYFFGNFITDKTMSLSVKGDYNTRYVVKDIPIKKRRSLGAHVGVNHLNQLDHPDLTWNHGHFRVVEVSTGLTWLTARNAKLEMSRTSIRQGSGYKRINLDAVFYTFRSIDVEEYTTTPSIPTDTGRARIVTVQTTDEVLKKIGYRLYLDGKTTDWGHGRFTFKYSIGIQSSPLKEDGLVPRIIGGLGIGYSFSI